MRLLLLAATFMISVIQIAYAEEIKLKVEIIYPHNTFEISGLKSTSTICDVKHYIQKFWNIEVDMQRVVFNGKELAGAPTIGDSGIKDGDKLYVIPRSVQGDAC